MNTSNLLRRALLALSLFFSVPAFAQTYLNQVGNTPFSTTIPLEQGSYDASTGNLHIEIPLGSWPQRGGHTFSAALVYDSRIWTPAWGPSSQVWQPVNVPGTGGWRLKYSPDTTGTNWGVQNAYTYPCPNDPYYTTFYTIFQGFIWKDSTGALHTFDGITQSDPNNCVGGDIPSSNGPAIDASGYSATIVNFTQVDSVTAPDGSLIFPYFEDPNGNYWGLNGSMTDTLGRTLVIATSNCNGNSNQTCYDVLNAQGSRSRYTVTTQSVSVSTSFGQDGITEYSGNITVVSDIQLPDNSHYSFTYDNGSSGTYGELASMTLPTAGAIDYSFTTFYDPLGNANRWLNSKSAGGNQWTFTPSATSSSDYSVLVTKPSGDQIQLAFTLDANATGGWNSSILYRNSSGSILGFRSTTWSSGPTDIQRLSDATTLTDSGTPITKQTQYNYIQPGGPWLSSIKEWNWQQGYSVTGTADRMTSFSNYCGTAPGSIVVTNGAQSVTASQTSITFDGYGGNLTSVTGAANHDDPNYGSSYVSRCNPTSVARWTGSAWLTTTMTYDTTGQVRSITDPNGNTASMSYADSFFDDNGSGAPTAHSGAPSTNAYLTQITQPLIGSTNIGYYYGTGQQAKLTDVNNQNTYSHFADPFSRPTQTNFPDGGWTLTEYSATDSNTFTGITDTTPSINCSGCRHDQTTVDPFGRHYTSVLRSDPAGADYVVTFYDSNGRPSSSSNPYRMGDTVYYTTPSYDALDRLTAVQQADGASSTARAFYGNSVTSNGGAASQLCSTGIGYPTLAVDEAGKKRQSWTDGFGRLVEVDEPDADNNMTWNTCYSYDLNNNLVGVNQGGQIRTYTYDALSRVTSVTTPESGNTTFTYDNNSNVHTRTDARNITTTYSYDALNRLTHKGYSDSTPGAWYVYDSPSQWGVNIQNPIGRLVLTSSYGASGYAETLSSFDAMGRVINQWQCTPLNCGSGTFYFAYSYNLLGEETAINYDGGFIVSTGYDAAGRPNQLTLPNSPLTLVSNIQYNPAGLKASWSDSNGINETRTYNNRLQPMQFYATNPNTSITPMNLTYSFVDSNGHNNGNLVSWNSYDYVPFLRTYTYDNLNRLSSFSSPSDPSGCTGLSWTYDRWGNRTAQTTTGGSCPNPTASYSGGNNRMDGYTYDAAGNVTNDGSHTYAYDAENRMISVDAGATTYVYDALGKRVERITGPNQLHYWYDTDGNVRVEWTQNSVWNDDYVYLGGELVAELGGPRFHHNDHLGSTRAMTDVNGNEFDWADYLPYGEVIAGGGSTTHKFTGDERDSETGLDHTLFRQYSSSLGRWSSPDPLAGDISDPQSLNRYSYVGNNPLAYVDPLGADQCGIGTRECPLPMENGLFSGSNTDFVQWSQVGSGSSTSQSSHQSIGAGQVAAKLGGTDSNGIFQPIQDLGSTYYAGVNSDAAFWMTGPSFSGFGGGGGGGIPPSLFRRLVNAACSVVPDAVSNGVGADAGLFLTGGVQVGTVANGKSGEFSFYATGTASFGLISFDAYVAGGVVPKLSHNSELNSTNSTGIATAVGRFGGSGGSGSYQLTAGPSLLPVTIAQQVSATKTFTIPAIGYVFNLPRAACKLVTGN